MKNGFYNTICVASLFISIAKSSSILAVYPVPSFSHQLVFRPLTLELIKHHDVTVITADPMFPKGEVPANLTEIDVHDVSYQTMLETSTKLEAADNNISETAVINLLVAKIIEKQLQSKDIQTLIQKKNDTFDLILVEACFRPALAFSHIFKAPVIQISSLGAIIGNYETIGGPMHTILYPANIHRKVYNLTMWEKIENLYTYFMIRINYWQSETIENGVLRKILGPDVPTLSELADNIDMLFLNVHPMWEGNFPVPPNVIHMGGLHQKPEKSLPKDLKSYLDASKTGVIYVSFGTHVNTSSLSLEKIQMMTRVFSKIPYDILWKVDDELVEQFENIRTSSWFPQSDLLRHPKIKLFISQGGLQSTDEAITAGVPLIGIPFFGDQWYNVEQYAKHGIGKYLEFKTLTEEKFNETIHTVIRDSSYRQNIVKLRELMQDQPETPLNRAIWWIEYVLRYKGAKHLRAPAHNMSFREYYEMDLVITILFSILFIVLGVWLILRVSYVKWNHSMKYKLN